MDENLTPEDLQRLRETLLELTDTVESLNRTLGGVSQSSDQLIESKKEEQKATEESADAIAARIEEEKKQKEAEQRLQASMEASFKSLQNSVKALTSAVFSGKEGYGKYQESLEAAGDAVDQFTSQLGPAAFILGKLFQGFVKLTSLQLEQADNVLKASDKLSNLGAVGDFTASELLGLAHKAGVFSKNLDLLIKPIASLEESLISLGGTTGAGAKAFTQIADVGEESRKRFSRLGISQEQLIQSQADFINLQRISGVAITDNMKKDGALRKASLEYTENLVELAALSGKDIERVKQEQEIARSGYASMIQAANLTRQIREAEAQGDTDRAAALRNELDSRNQLLDTIQTQIGDAELLSAAQKFLATGTYDETSKMLLGLGIPMEDFARRIKQGEDVSAEFLESFKKGVEKNAAAFEYSAAIVGEQGMKYYGLTEKNLQALAKLTGRNEEEIRRTLEEQIASAAQEGFDPAKDLRAELQSAERSVNIFADSLLASQNGLLQGYNSQILAMNAATAALYALAAAAGAAILSRGMEQILNRMPGRRGRVPGGTPDVPTARTPTQTTRPDLPSARPAQARPSPSA
jgi:hypothetical protein